MNFIKVFTGNYGESNTGENQSEGVESTILTLRSRLKSSQLLADRRDAVRGLKSLAKSYRKEVADLCLEPLIECLCKDRNDHELIALCLDALTSIFNDSDDPTVRLGDGHRHQAEAPSEEELTKYAEKLTKEELFSVILACLEEYDFPIRFPSIRLLISLLQLRTREVQQLVLLNPTAVARFMDLLSDVREVIRNDVLVLLIHLTRGNSSIQKIVVFENVFEKLFAIMLTEGHADGGVVTQDCLELLLSLLAGNSANQLLFREGSFVQHLVPFFDSLPTSPLSVQKTWTPEKTTNFVYMFQLIRHLVSPGSGQQQIMTVQKIALQCGLLRKISEMFNEAGIPGAVMVEALGAVGELTRDMPQAQDSVIQLTAASARPSRPLIVLFLNTLINDKQPLNIRLALLYCIQCLLYRNKPAQLKLIKGMSPDSSDASEHSASANQTDSQLAFSTSAGQLIISGLLALDSPSTWLSAGVLAAALGNGGESADLRDALLSAELTLSLGAQPVTLLQQITSTLAKQKLRLSTRAGLLQLLCVWLAYSSNIVDALLSDSPTVACLLSQVSQPPSDSDEAVVRSLSAFAIGLCILFNRQTDQKLEYNRDKLVMIVRRRIGIETFGDALAAIASNESYARCLRSPRPHLMDLSKREDASEITINRLPLFTHEFSIIYRQLEYEVLATLSVTHERQTSTGGYIHPDSTHRSSPFDIASQNQTQVNDRIAALEANLTDRNAECEQLRRELGSYKMALADGANEYRSVLAEKDRTIGTLQAELMGARSFAQLRGEERNSSECVSHVAEIERLKAELSSQRQEQEDLLLLLSHQDSRLARLREKLKALGQQDSEEEEEDDDEVEDDVDDGAEEDGAGGSGGADGKRHSPRIKGPDVALGESAFGPPPPREQNSVPVDVKAPPNQPAEQQQQISYYDPSQYQQSQPYYPEQQVQTPQYPPPPPATQHGYPYGNSNSPSFPYQAQQQSQPIYPYGYYGQPQQSSANGSVSLENYFKPETTVGGQCDFPVGVQDQDGDGSGSGTTSDSQNSQIRIQ